MIFKSYSRPNENNKDPFRPVELNNYKNNNGAPPKSSAKPRKPSRILKNITNQNEQYDISPAEQKRNTKRIRKNIRNAKVFKLIVIFTVCVIFFLTKFILQENTIKSTGESLTTTTMTTSFPTTLIPENNFPLNIQQPTYSQNDHTSSSTSQLIQPPLNSYMYSTNLPISFSSPTPYYSNSMVQSNNCPPDQNPYPIAVNSNSLVSSQTASSTSMNFSSSDNRLLLLCLIFFKM